MRNFTCWLAKLRGAYHLMLWQPCAAEDVMPKAALEAATLLPGGTQREASSCSIAVEGCCIAARSDEGGQMLLHRCRGLLHCCQE